MRFFDIAILKNKEDDYYTLGELYCIIVANKH